MINQQFNLKLQLLYYTVLVRLSKEFPNNFYSIYKFKSGLAVALINYYIRLHSPW